MPKIAIPNEEDRTVVIGLTGSGKTFAALWLLALQSIDTMPWIIFDFKRDKNIAQIPFAEYIGIGTLPDEPGVYIVQPKVTDIPLLNDYLEQIWEHENIGIYVDEGGMFVKVPAFDNILMQGRSKHIPVIINVQRPVDVSRYVFSQATFVQVFQINDERDQKIVSAFTPLYKGEYKDAHLPEYHSWWYDVRKRTVTELRPVPKMSVIMGEFKGKLEYVDEAIPESMDAETVEHPSPDHKINTL